MVQIRYAHGLVKQGAPASSAATMTSPLFCQSSERRHRCRRLEDSISFQESSLETYKHIHYICIIHAVFMKNKKISFLLLDCQVKKKITIANTSHATANYTTTITNMTRSKYFVKVFQVPDTIINALHVQMHLLLTALCDAYYV